MRLTGFQLYLLLTAIAISAFLTSLDGFIVNVAITSISGELGIPEDVGTWMITLFSTASTVCIAISGYLSRRISDYRIFMAALFTFMCASLGVGLSKEFEVLLIWRIVQGMGSGFLTPVSLTLIIRNFPPEKRSMAVGFWGFFVLVGPAMGPMVGGWLSNNHWPWMFFLNIPFCLFSLTTVWALLKEEKKVPTTQRLDLIGMALLSVWVGAPQIAMNRWNIDDWFRSPFITTLFIIAAICLLLFLIWELYHPEPFIDLRLLKNRNFALPSFTTGIALGLLFSSFVLDSLWVQDILGYTPAWAGLTLTPVGIFPLILYPLMGRFVGLLDLRIWVFFSFLLYACTFFWLSHLTVYTSYWHLAFPRLIQGIGFAFFTVPNSLLTVQGVAPERLTTNISVFSFIRTLFVGYGVSLSITLWIFRETFYQSRITARTAENNPLFQQLVAPFYGLTGGESESFALTYQTLVNHASTLALADIYYLFAWIFLGLASLVPFYKRAFR